MPLKAHQCQAAEKGWHDFAGSQILSNWRYKFEAQVDIFVLTFDCVLTGWTSTMPFDWYSDWPWCPSGLNCFFSPEVQQVYQKQSSFLIWESLDVFLSPRRHHTSESSQTRRPRPLRRSKWAKCSPSLRSGLKIWPQMLQKSCWKKWASESTPKKTISTERCRQIWVKKSYWNNVPMLSISVIFSCCRNMKHSLFCGASSTTLPFTCLPVLLAKHIVEVQAHLGATM